MHAFYLRTFSPSVFETGAKFISSIMNIEVKPNSLSDLEDSKWWCTVKYKILLSELYEVSASPIKFIDETGEYLYLYW